METEKFEGKNNPAPGLPQAINILGEVTRRKVIEKFGGYLPGLQPLETLQKPGSNPGTEAVSSDNQ